MEAFGSGTMPAQSSRRAPDQRQSTVVAGIAVVMLLSGCAATPSQPAVNAAAGELYDGQPEIVFATEFPTASAAEARARADEALAKGDVDLALFMYVRAVAMDDSDTGSLYRIGRIHTRRGNTALAARAFARTVAVDPDHAGAWQALGLIYIEEQQYAQAQLALTRAIAVDPNLWRAYNGLGILADLEEKFDVAIAHYDAALAISPNLPGTLNNRGYSHYLAGEWAAAANDFQDALLLDPNMEGAWRNLGLVHARQGKYREALGILERVSSAHSAYNDVGYIAMLRGDYRVAEQMMLEAIRLSPTFFEMAQDNLAEVRRQHAKAASALNAQES